MNPAQVQALENLADVVREEAYSGFRVSRPEGGKYVRALEARFASTYQRNAIACSSATAGLYMALRAAGVGFGDRVLVPAYTMSATAAAVVMCGATPVWVDVHPRNGLMTTESVAEAHNWVVDEGDQPPVAIIFVHAHGICYNTSAWRQAIPNMKIIEDCAQAFMNWEPDTKLLAGTGGDFGVFSFKQGKPLSCGEGGMVLARENTDTEKLMRLRNHGEIFEKDLMGFNFHMTELQAAVAAAYFDLACQDQAARAAAALMVDQRLVNLEHFHEMGIRSGAPFVYHVVAHDVDLAGPEGFTRGYHKPLCCLPWYKRNLQQGCQVNTHLFTSVCWWTKPPRTKEDVDRLVHAVYKANGK